MIRGRGQPSELDELRAALRTRLGQDSGERDGPLRFHLGSRPAGDALEMLLIGFWASPEAAAQADARRVSPLQIARDMLQDVRAGAFEVDASIVRRSDVQPVALRVATGRFSKPGTDIEMQELLRQRAPGVGEEMTEAYVGRRLVGHSIEVTFVSAWQRLPEDRDLDGPFWTDIALRYDEFGVEVYTAVPIDG